MKEFLEYKLLEVSHYTITVWALVSILLIYIATRILIAMMTRFFHRLADRRNMERGRQYSFLMLLRYFIWIFAFSQMLFSLGIQPTFLLTSSAALLVGLGLGLQKIFSDCISGVFLLFDGTIEQGDILQVGTMVGRIETINLRTSVFRDRSDMTVIIPNHKFIEESVINWSHDDNITQFSIKMTVSYQSDMEKVRGVLLACAQQHPDVIQKESRRPEVRMANFEEKGMAFELLFHSENMFQIESVKSDLRFMVWKAFQEKDIKVPG